MSASVRSACNAAAAAALGAAAYVLLLGYRSDYAGHFLSGFGATLLLLAGLVRIRTTGRWDVVAVVAVAILIGFGTESTVFKDVIFDPVDFFNQSIGACLAGAVVLDRPRSLPFGPALVIVAVNALALGFVFAYS